MVRTTHKIGSRVECKFIEKVFRFASFDDVAGKGGGG